MKHVIAQMRRGSYENDNHIIARKLVNFHEVSQNNECT
jgi:hypothetical protein